MERTESRDDAAEAVFGVAAVLTAGGVLTFALFPLLLPTVVLLAVLAVPLLPLAVIGAVVIGLARQLRRPRRTPVPDASRRRDPLESKPRVGWAPR